jgi:gliding motility-associated-like protein
LRRFAVDPPVFGTLSASVRVETLDGMTVADFPFSQTDSLRPSDQPPGMQTFVSRACGTPACELLGETLRIISQLDDSSRCTLEHRFLDTLYVQVVPPLPGPLNLSVDFGNYPVQGDTVTLFTKYPNCLTLVLDDPLNRGSLKLEAVTPLTELTPALTLLPDTGQTRLQAGLCWSPACDQLGTLWPVTLKGISRPNCQYSLDTLLTFWIRVAEPPNRPPLVDWLPLAVNLLQAGETVCFGAVVSDPDTFTLLSSRLVGPSSMPSYLFGSGAVWQSTGENPQEGQACFTPNCYLSDSVYLLTLCAIDSTLCTRTDSVCATLELRIDPCWLEMPNVFTPNGDGINDNFRPGQMPGIERIELTIFDRWGTRLYSGTDPTGWNGDYRNQPATAGTYYFTVRYWLYSGTGPLRFMDRTGSFTLLK